MSLRPSTAAPPAAFHFQPEPLPYQYGFPDTFVPARYLPSSFSVPGPGTVELPHQDNVQAGLSASNHTASESGEDEKDEDEDEDEEEEISCATPTGRVLRTRTSSAAANMDADWNPKGQSASMNKGRVNAGVNKRKDVPPSPSSSSTGGATKRNRVHTEKRKLQNRSNQRAFRERREKHIKETEENYEHLIQLTKSQQSEIEGLRQLLDGLEGQLHAANSMVKRLSHLGGTVHGGGHSAYPSPPRSDGENGSGANLAKAKSPNPSTHSHNASFTNEGLGIRFPSESTDRRENEKKDASSPNKGRYRQKWVDLNQIDGIPLSLNNGSSWFTQDISAHRTQNARALLHPPVAPGLPAVA